MPFFSKRSIVSAIDDPFSITVDAERRFAQLRVAVVASGTLLSPFLLGKPGTRPWLGYTLLAIGWVYSLSVVFLEKRLRTRRSFAPWATMLSDSIFTIVALCATGGVSSQWFVVLFLLIVALSARQRPRQTIALGFLCGLEYVAMAAYMGQLGEFAGTILIRVTYMILTAGAAAVLAREKMDVMASRLRLLDVSQEVASAGSWVWSIDDGKVQCSRGLVRLLELEDGETLSHKVYLAATHPDDREEIRTAFARALKERTPFQMEHRMLRRDGTTRWVLSSGRVFGTDDGKAHEVVGAAQDVTERRQIQAALVRTERLASIGTLASGIAHEINNPLAYIATNLELMERQLEEKRNLHDSEKQRVRDAVAAARHGASRVREIVRGLSASSRADDAARGPVDLGRVADLAIAMVAHEVRGRAHLVRDYVGAPLAFATESLVSQVIVNLLVNATQAIERGSAEENEIRVSIGFAAKNRVFVQVSDSGCGIPEEHIGRIFDPFFTTKPPGVGTGLGLSICHGIVRDLNGEITVESFPNHGSTFRAEFPLAHPSAPAATESLPAPSGPKKRKMRVLVIDDEALFARSLRDLLSFDYEVTLANEGAFALELFRGGDRFDVILCDLMMPGLSGMDLHRELGAIAPEQQRRMIFLTGGATTERAHAFLSNSTIQHLEKPIALPKLEAAIEQTRRVGESAA